MDLRLLTLTEIKELQRLRLDELVTEAGNIKHLAYMLDKSAATVTGWVERGRISKEGALIVQSHSKLGGKFTAEYLRPDINMKK